MSTRFYLSALVNLGQEEGYVSRCAQLATELGAEKKDQLPALDENGQFVKQVAITVVTTNNHNPFIEDPDIDNLPAIAFHIGVHALSAKERTRFEALMSYWELSLEEYAPGVGWDEVLTNLGKQINSDFDPNNFDTGGLG